MKSVFKTSLGFSAKMYPWHLLKQRASSKQTALTGEAGCVTLSVAVHQCMRGALLLSSGEGKRWQNSRFSKISFANTPSPKALCGEGPCAHQAGGQGQVIYGSLVCSTEPSRLSEHTKVTLNSHCHFLQ